MITNVATKHSSLPFPTVMEFVKIIKPKKNKKNKKQKSRVMPPRDEQKTKNKKQKTIFNSGVRG
jgi:hypothetical protein